MPSTGWQTRAEILRYEVSGMCQTAAARKEPSNLHGTAAGGERFGGQRAEGLGRMRRPYGTGLPEKWSYVKEVPVSFQKAET